MISWYLNTLITNKYSYRMNSSMGCSSVCEKNKDESGGGKLKEITFTPLIKTLL